MSDDLVTWLRAQLDEDERWAKLAAHQAGSAAWEPEEGAGTTVISRVRIGPGRFFESLGEEGFASEHIARHDPARVLAEVAAKRAIIAEAFRHAAKIDSEWGDCHDADQIAAGLCPETAVDKIPILRILALPNADRPGYREEWKP